MKVRVLRRHGHRGGSVRPGDVIDVSAIEGARKIAIGHAEAYHEDVAEDVEVNDPAAEVRDPKVARRERREGRRS